jgi:hypothetical protein
MDASAHFREFFSDVLPLFREIDETTRRSGAEPRAVDSLRRPESQLLRKAVQRRRS